MAWVFQGNPDRFDIDDYVARYPQLIYWRTPRHAKEIKVGDRAYLWRSGADAGAIAAGVVVEAPSPGNRLRHPEAVGTDLWRADPPDPNEFKTGIQLEDIRLTTEDGLLPRSVVREDAELSKSTIITIPNGTVFPLNAAQSRAFERLWVFFPTTTDLGHTASEGDKKLRAHYRRERSSSLRIKKLEEFRRVHGRCYCELCKLDQVANYPPSLVGRIFEVHHLSPLSKAIAPVRTALDDLAVLCANCHRAVHATADVEDNYRKLRTHLDNLS